MKVCEDSTFDKVLEPGMLCEELLVGTVQAQVLVSSRFQPLPTKPLQIVYFCTSSLFISDLSSLKTKNDDTSVKLNDLMAFK